MRRNSHRQGTAIPSVIAVLQRSGSFHLICSRSCEEPHPSGMIPRFAVLSRRCAASRPVTPRQENTCTARVSALRCGHGRCGSSSCMFASLDMLEDTPGSIDRPCAGIPGSLSSDCGGIRSGWWWGKAPHHLPSCDASHGQGRQEVRSAPLTLAA